MHSTSYPPQIIKVSKGSGCLKFIGYTVLIIVLLLGVLVYIGSQQVEKEQPTSSALFTPQTKIGTRNSPVPVGRTHRLDVEQFNALTGANKKQFAFEMTVNSHVRGDQAAEIVKDWNQYNPDPSEGREYYLIRVSITVVESKSGDALSINQGVMSLVSSNGVKYNSIYGVSSNDTIYKELYEGAKVTGWLVHEVNIDDPTPLLEVAGTWFSTN